MTLRMTLAASIAAIATLAAAGAHAAVLYDAPAAIPEQADNTSHIVTFTGPAGPAHLSFTLDGYASLDGNNWYEDDFTLSLNGLDIFKATYNLGGGGSDVVYTNLNGFTADNVSLNSAHTGPIGTEISWGGGQVNIAGLIGLNAGLNTLKFNYTALPYNGGQNAGWQDMGDEGWGVEKVLVTSGAVPEPTSWALMLVGFCGLGAMLRRARSQDGLRVRA